MRSQRATGQNEDKQPEPPTSDEIRRAMSALGWTGGLKGKARAEILTPKKRSEIVKKAAAARWKDKDIT